MVRRAQAHEALKEYEGALDGMCSWALMDSLEPRLSSSFSSLAVQTASDEKLDESLGSRLHCGYTHSMYNIYVLCRL